MDHPVVSIVMGSSSDWQVMRHAASVLKNFCIPHETMIISAHRTPDRMFEYAETAHDRGIRCIIAGAGGAAHLPGMIAAKTTLPFWGFRLHQNIYRVWIHCYPSYRCPRVCQLPLLPSEKQVQPTPHCLLLPFWPGRYLTGRKTRSISQGSGCLCRCDDAPESCT